MTAQGIPLHHLSIRVPWHDTGWNGTICRDPVGNSACLRLKNISLKREDEAENRLAGSSLEELDSNRLPPCVAERATFMAPFSITRTVEHPYKGTSNAHSHYAATPLTLPAYSAGCVPFRWMLRENVGAIADTYGIVYHDEAEIAARELMGFESSWIQDVENQRRVLDAFFSAIVPDSSLAFFYAKEVSFVEDPRRVLIGAGRVTFVGDNIEYNYSERGQSRSMIWERPLGHSIRPGFDDGFLLPYHDAIARFENDPSFDPADVAVFAPDENFDQFSYGSEHLTHDNAVSTLLNVIDGLERAERALGASQAGPLRWCGERLGELWRLRGPFPGLGSALHALGVDNANLLAYRLASQLGENENPWPLVARVMDNPGELGPEWQKRLGATTVRMFQSLPAERRALLELIARFDLSNEQAERFFVAEHRRREGIAFTDRELLENPYLLYEADRTAVDPIAVRTIDRGAYPAPAVADAHPLPAPSALVEAVDPRRVRALLVAALEQRAEAGDTLAPQDDLVLSVRDLSIEPPCPVNADLLAVLDEELAPTLTRVPLADGRSGLQLDRLALVGDGIRSEVGRRARAAKRHEVDADWAAALDDVLGVADPADDDEARAREEKIAALTELAAARVAVLIGPAGTGKTTLLAALCANPMVKSAGVLLLAPTGKARVQLEKGFGRSAETRARTIAEFLIRSERYNPHTGAYRRSDSAKVANFGTVIIDEASMLTEEQLDAVLDAVSNVQRLILVGDPRQLPPIGAGRPFVDAVRFLAGTAPDRFPRVGNGYAELTVRRRQAGTDRDDLALAEWFGGESPSALADEVWGRVLQGSESSTLRFVQWNDSHEVPDALAGLLVQEIEEIGDLDDEEGFGISLGGVRGKNGGVFFNNEYKDRRGSGSSAENWQVLSPVRGNAHGVTELNRALQHQFRAQAIEYANVEGWGRKTPKPMGAEGIVYGDKVINVANHVHKSVWPEERRDVSPVLESLKYVANGEIGMVVGRFRFKRTDPMPKNLEVEFATQPGFGYKFWPNDFPDDGSAKLELAYAVTIHKSQGSEFGTTFLVLPNPCRLLSRELLYTALTRQTKRVVVLHQGPLAELLAYSSVAHSETARRLTNLFDAPLPREVHGRFLEDGLIHRTAEGNLVRSKSEVIIADALAAHHVSYEYEQPFTGADGSQRMPDFTIEDAATGETYLWEHLGMLGSPQYRKAWERKLRWYEESGVLPIEAGGGKRAALIVTRDDEKGGIDSQRVRELIQTTFGR